MNEAFDVLIIYVDQRYCARLLDDFVEEFAVEGKPP